MNQNHNMKLTQPLKDALAKLPRPPWRYYDAGWEAGVVAGEDEDYEYKDMLCGGYSCEGIKHDDDHLVIFLLAISDALMANPELINEIWGKEPQ